MISAASMLIGSCSSNCAVVAGDEGEVRGRACEVRRAEIRSDDAAVVEERQIALVFWFEIVKRDAGKIGNDDVAGNFFVRPSLARS